MDYAETLAIICSVCVFGLETRRSDPSIVAIAEVVKHVRCSGKNGPERKICSKNKSLKRGACAEIAILETQARHRCDFGKAAISESPTHS